MFAPPGKEFMLAHRKLVSLKDLAGALRECSQDEFDAHQARQDFSAWIGDVFCMEPLARKVAKLGKEDMAKAIEGALAKLVYDVVIIGAGIAGMTAAVYAARNRMKFRLLSEDLGGQMNVAGEIGNWPGISQINFLDFMKNFEDQLKHNNVQVEYLSVKSIKKSNGYFKVETDKGKVTTKAVIIATGARPRRLGVPGEKEFDKKGVTYCSWCDGPLFKDKPVAIVGGGASALEAAEFMAKISPTVYLVNLAEGLGGHANLREKVKALKNVKVINKAHTTKILGDKFVTGLAYRKDDKETTLDVKGIIVEVGRIPNTDFVKGFVDLDDDGHIVVDKHAKTSVDGVYATGDCSDIHGYQFVTAAGTGCMALLRASRYLQERKR